GLLAGEAEDVGALRLPLLLGRDTFGGALQELEDVLHDVATRGGGVDSAARAIPLHAGAEHQARPIRAGGRALTEDRHEHRRCVGRPIDRLPLRLEPAADWAA